MNLTYKIEKSQEFVFDCLTSMSKFVAAHPVITKMEYQGDNKYLVFETLKIGLIPFSFTYEASIEVCFERKMVVMTATVMRFNTIEMIFDVKEVQGFSVINEVISFKTKLPVKLMLGQILKKQHALLFKNIKNNL